jgi:hypothetical protein
MFRLPEIFDIVASHLPLYARASTLLALALTSHQIKEIIIPWLLYKRVWFEGDKSRLIALLGMLKEKKKKDGETPRGHHIRRLSITHRFLLSTSAH